MAYGGRHDIPAPPLRGFDHVNRYWDKEHEVVAAKILPGEYYVTNGNELVTTVLGSCISACIRDRVFGIGGMNHFMLPTSDTGSWHGSDNALSTATRYGNYAMEHMINDILANGGHRSHLEVKIIGGGRIIGAMTDVGGRNIEFVREYIRTEGLRLLGEDVGDIYPRKVVFFPATGRVRVKKLKHLHNDTVVKRERSYMTELAHAPIEGEVELF